MGLGILFTGMVMMVNTASTFSDLPILGEILQNLSNPFLGVLAGALVTALIQSSSATVGILLALSATGKITFATAVPIILGQNIGTCATSMIASAGGNKNARSVATVHLYFNLIGTIIFLIGIYTYQHFIGFSFWNGPIDMGGIANFHTLFNIVSTIVLFPFIKQIEKLTILTVRDNPNEEDENEEKYLAELNKLDERVTKIPSIAIGNTVTVIAKMGEIANKNFIRATELLDKFDNKNFERIKQREDITDKMDEKTTKYLVTLGNKSLSVEENLKINSLMRVDSEFEKIVDYTYELAKVIEHMKENDIKLSETAIKTINNMFNLTQETIIKVNEFLQKDDLKLSIDIQALKDVGEIKREEYKTEHIKRLKQEKCNVESGISYIEILNVLEKIVNHCYNISIELSNIINHKRFITKQEYSNKMYKNSSKEIKEKFDEYITKFEF